MALAIRTPVGVVIHTGDFKIDVTPVQGEMIDIARLGQLGKQGVLALLSDSTNVERPGHTESERKVADKFDELFKGCDKRIIVATFASNVQRIQQIINVAAKYKRRVAVTGRSMENMLRVAMELGYMDIPDGVLMELTQIKGQPKDRTVIISTGSQGENMSALYRMAYSEHRQINIDANDRIIISEVIYDRHTDLHVSGHASQEEQKMMLALTRPRFFIPVHGEYRMLCKHAEIAHGMGIEPNNTVVAENGDVIELSRKTVKITDHVQAGRVFVDGSGVGDVGSVVLRDRKHLAEDGMIVVTVALSNEDNGLVGGPEVITRGFIYERDSEALIDEIKRVVHESLASCRHQKITDYNAIKNKIRTNLTGYLYKTTKRSPMILPMIITI